MQHTGCDDPTLTRPIGHNAAELDSDPSQATMNRSTLGCLGTGSTGLSTDNWPLEAMPLTRSDHPARTHLYERGLRVGLALCHRPGGPFPSPGPRLRTRSG